MLCDKEISNKKSNHVSDEETDTRTISLSADPNGSLNFSAKQNNTHTPSNTSNKTTGGCSAVSHQAVCDLNERKTYLCFWTFRYIDKASRIFDTSCWNISSPRMSYFNGAVDFLLQIKITGRWAMQLFFFFLQFFFLRLPVYCMFSGSVTFKVDNGAEVSCRCWGVGGCTLCDLFLFVSKDFYCCASGCGADGRVSVIWRWL